MENQAPNTNNPDNTNPSPFQSETAPVFQNTSKPESTDFPTTNDLNSNLPPQNYTQPTYEQPTYGQNPYNQNTYGQNPYGQNTSTQGAYNPNDPYAQNYTGYQQYNPNYTNNSYQPAKSRVVAGILGIILGALGVHNFYLGFITKGIIQLLISLLSLGMLAPISYIWGLIEGILYLTGQNNPNWSYDANGVKLQD